VLFEESLVVGIVLLIFFHVEVLEVRDCFLDICNFDVFVCARFLFDDTEFLLSYWQRGEP
jgi:hypothetical protein